MLLARCEDCEKQSLHQLLMIRLRCRYVLLQPVHQLKVRGRTSLGHRAALHRSNQAACLVDELLELGVVLPHPYLDIRRQVEILRVA